MKLKLGFFASGNGSNVKAILDNIRDKKLQAEAKIVISNNPSAKVLATASEYSVPQVCLNEHTYSREYDSLDDAIINTLQKHEVNMVLLAGYLKPISDKVIEKFPNRILNIHPSLLPSYGGKGMYGKNVHQAVIESRDKFSGASVHLVTGEDYDSGPILAQCMVPRYFTDTAETLAARVLEFEHVLYSRVLKDIEQGIIKINGFY